MRKEEDIIYFADRMIELHQKVKERDEIIKEAYKMLDNISRYGIKLNKAKEYQDLCRNLVIKIRKLSDEK